MKNINNERNISLLKKLCYEYGYDLIIRENEVVLKVVGLENEDDEFDVYKYGSIKEALISWKETLIESDKCNDEPVWEKEIEYINSLEENN